MRVVVFFAFALNAVVAAMAGTRSEAWRRPVVHRGAAGTVVVAPSMDDAVQFARVAKHKLLVKKIHDNREAFPFSDVQACIDSSSNGAQVDECFVDGQTEADGWGM